MGIAVLKATCSPQLLSLLPVCILRFEILAAAPAFCCSASMACYPSGAVKPINPFFCQLSWSWCFIRAEEM